MNRIIGSVKKYFADRLAIRDNTNNPYKLKTLIMAGYNPYIAPNGCTMIGEPIFKPKRNEVSLGGSLFILSQIFDVNLTSNVASLNEIKDVATSGVVSQPSAPSKINYFCVGTGGCDPTNPANINIFKQQYREIPGMIPFRVVNERLSGVDAEKYFFAVTRNDGKIAYYLKKFEGTPVVRCLWKDGREGVDGSAINFNDIPNVYSNPETNRIEVFVECTLKFEATDFREYFQLNPSSTPKIFNALGLCSGHPCTINVGGSAYTEVKDAMAVTGLTFTNEPLHMNKALTYVYRIYV